MTSGIYASFPWNVYRKKHVYIENLFFWGMEEPRATKNRKRASNWDNFIAMESLEWDGRCS